MTCLKIPVLEQGRPLQLLSLLDCEHTLGFSLLCDLTFSHPLLRQELCNQGLCRLQQSQVSQRELDLGALRKKALEKRKGLSQGAASVPVSVRFVSEAVGYGLFAETDIPTDAFVIEYIGIVRKNDQRLSMNHYLYRYPCLDNIGRPFVIDAHCGNLARFINHSEDNNLRVEFAFDQGLYHALMIATKPIFKGEQLCYNYGKSYWYIRGSPERLS